MLQYLRFWSHCIVMGMLVWSTGLCAEAGTLCTPSLVHIQVPLSPPSPPTTFTAERGQRDLLWCLPFLGGRGHTFPGFKSAQRPQATALSTLHPKLPSLCDRSLKQQVKPSPGAFQLVPEHSISLLSLRAMENLPFEAGRTKDAVSGWQPPKHDGEKPTQLPAAHGGGEVLPEVGWEVDPTCEKTKIGSRI